MRGPLVVLRETWEVDEKSSEIVVSYVLSVQEKLDKMTVLVEENLKEAQQTQNSGMIKRPMKESSRLMTKYWCYFQVRQVNC